VLLKSFKAAKFPKYFYSPVTLDKKGKLGENLVYAGRGK
jgi:hypothetical protein